MFCYIETTIAPYSGWYNESPWRWLRAEARLIHLLLALFLPILVSDEHLDFLLFQTHRTYATASCLESATDEIPLHLQIVPEYPDRRLPSQNSHCVGQTELRFNHQQHVDMITHCIALNQLQPALTT